MTQSVRQFSMIVCIDYVENLYNDADWEPTDTVCVTGEHCKTVVYYIDWNRCKDDSVTMNRSYVEPKGTQAKFILQNLFLLTVSDVIL